MRRLGMMERRKWWSWRMAELVMMIHWLLLLLVEVVTEAMEAVLTEVEVEEVKLPLPVVEEVVVVKLLLRVEEDEEEDPIMLEEMQRQQLEETTLSYNREPSGSSDAASKH